MPAKKPKTLTVVPTQTSEPKPLSTARFRKSDRLEAALSGSTKSIGYSCNFFRVEDSIASIAEAATWALQVSAYQGAPSLDLSQLRPRNSTVESGGTSSGAASFSAIFDAIVGSMRRPTKKNGAGICWLDWNHGDLKEFLELPFSYAYKGIYIPGNHNPEEQKQFLASPLASYLAKAYEEGKCFICKRPEGGMLLNLCTEIENVSRGGCILGVINLAQYTLDSLPELALDFTKASLDMLGDMNVVLRLAQDSPLVCREDGNRQFGLGVSGLASLLANVGVSYEDFTKALESVNFELGILHAYVPFNSPAEQVTHYIIEAYKSASLALQGQVRAAFCVQPSATGAYECADSAGYTSSPELQPVYGIRNADGVFAVRKSALLGDLFPVFHPATETINDVPYSTYARLCSAWQRLLNSTGMGHRHSACFYGDRFTKTQLEKFVSSDQRSLYYRLPSYNTLALDKTQVGEGLKIDESFSVDALRGGGACGLVQVPGAVECDCAA